MSVNVTQALVEMELSAYSVLVAFLAAMVVGVVAWLRERWRQQRLFQRYGIPGPEPSSILFGNWRELRSDTLGVLSKWIGKYGSFFGFYVGEMPFIVMSDLEMIKHCFVREAHTFRDRMSMILDVETFERSLVGLKGDEWKKVRNVMNPSFSGAKMKFISTIMNGCVNDMLEVLDEELAKGKTSVDVSLMTQGLTMDAIAKSLLAWEPDAQRNPEDPFIRTLRNTLTEADTPIFNAAVAFPAFRCLVRWVFPYVTYGKLFSRICGRVRNVMRVRRMQPDVRHVDMLQLMMDERAKSKCTDGNGEASRSEDNDSGGFTITDEHIVSNCFIALVAGFETTAVTLALMLDELARNPMEQEKLHNELASAFPAGIDEDVGHAQLQSLKRLDMVVSEGLRKNSPLVLFTARTCYEETTVMGRTVPAGCSVLAPVWHIHRDPKLWPNPEKFDPERFNGDSESVRHPIAYIPFGVGPRECFGKKFALLELKTALCKMILKYHFSLRQGSEDVVKLTVPFITLSPLKNIVLSVTLREHAA